MEKSNTKVKMAYEWLQKIRQQGISDDDIWEEIQDREWYKKAIQSGGTPELIQQELDLQLTRPTEPTIQIPPEKPSPFEVRPEVAPAVTTRVPTTQKEIEEVEKVRRTEQKTIEIAIKVLGFPQTVVLNTLAVAGAGEDWADIPRAIRTTAKGERLIDGRELVKRMGIPIDDPEWQLKNPKLHTAAETLGAWYDTTGTDPWTWWILGRLKPRIVAQREMGRTVIKDFTNMQSRISKRLVKGLKPPEVPFTEVKQSIIAKIVKGKPVIKVGKEQLGLKVSKMRTVVSPQQFDMIREAEIWGQVGGMKVNTPYATYAKPFFDVNARNISFWRTVAPVRDVVTIDLTSILPKATYSIATSTSSPMTIAQAIITGTNLTRLLETNPDVKIINYGIKKEVKLPAKPTLPITPPKAEKGIIAPPIEEKVVTEPPVRAIEEIPKELEPLAMKERKPLYIDKYGKKIIKKVRDYEIAVNRLDSPTLITIWKEDKKIGWLRTAEKAVYKLRGYTQVEKVEILPKHRKEGLATELYKTLLNYLPAGKLGIGGYTPDVVAKKIIPKIYKKLGGEFDEKIGHYVIKVREPVKPTPEEKVEKKPPVKPVRYTEAERKIFAGYEGKIRVAKRVGDIKEAERLREELNILKRPTEVKKVPPVTRAEEEISPRREVEGFSEREIKRFVKARRTPTPTEKIEQVKRSEIAKNLAGKLNVPIRIGKFRTKALGIYKRKGKIIRVRVPVDIETISHEMGHYLDDVLKVNKDVALHPKMTTELYDIAPRKQRRTPAEGFKEGFAEFIRRYITNPDELSTSPEFMKYWDKKMQENPEVNEVLLEARRDWNRWLELPAVAKVMSHISPTPERTGKSIKNRIENLYTMAKDDLFPLKKVSDTIKKKGIKILPQDDAYILARLHRGWHGKADAFFHHKTFDANFNWVGKPLNEIYRPIGKLNAMDEFDAYLVSKRTIEYHNRGFKTGLSIIDAKTAIKELERKYPIFEKKAEELYEYQDAVLRYALDSELIDVKTFKKFKELNRFYVPFYRVMDIAGRQGLLGKGMADVPSIFKKVKGSEREIIRPSESIVKNTYTIIEASERNQIKLALVRLAEQYPNDLGRLIEKIPPKLAKVASVSMEELQKQFKEDDIKVPADIIKKTIDIFRPSILKPGQNIITVMRDGKKEFYEVSPEIYNSLAATDRESLNFIVKMLSIPARMLRMGAVIYSPDFWARNPARDALTAYCYSKYGFLPGIDTMRGLFSLLKKDEMYWKWKIGGGEHAMLTSLDRAYLQQNVRDLIATKSQKVKNVVRHPTEALRVISEYGEEITRIGEFKLGMGNARRWFLMAETTKDLSLKSKILQSAYSSREVTLDFARLGTKTKAVNAMIPFWNANVEGTDRLRRAFNDNPIRTMYRIFFGITLPSILLWFANKDDERYKELPQWQKDLFWIILTPKYIVRIPKPFEVGIIFGSLPEHILDYIKREDPETFKQIAKSIMEGASPGYLPTAFQVPIESVANYNFFLQRPIVSEGLKRLPPELQHRFYTPETSKLIGKALKVSPLKVDHFIRGFTGGAGRVAQETFDAILRTTNVSKSPVKPQKTLADVPIIRGFIAREPVGSTSESVNKFYDIYEKAQEGHYAIEKLKEEKEWDIVKRYKQKYPESRHIKYLRKTAKQLSDLRKRRTKIEQSRTMSSKDKRLKMMSIERLMMKKAQETISFIKEHPLKTWELKKPAYQYRRSQTYR